MLQFAVFLILVFTGGSEAVSCSDCVGDFETAIGAGGATEADKCTAAKALVTCIEGADSGCPLTSAQVTTVTDGMDGVACADITDAGLCKCRYDYEVTVKADAAATCAALFAEVLCVKELDRTQTACDGSTLHPAKVTTLESTISSTCTGDNAPTPGCLCELEYAKQAISSTAEICTASKKFITCAAGNSGNGCDSGETLTSLATSASEATSCDMLNACECEKTWALADVAASAAACTAAKAYISCVAKEGITTTGCSTGSIMTLATRAGQVDPCTFENACLCEKTWTGTEVDTEEKACTAAKAYISCVFGETGDGCTSGTSIMTLATKAAATTPCTFSGACDCEKTLTTADLGDKAKQCTAAKNAITCVAKASAGGCAADRDRKDVGQDLLQFYTTTVTAAECALTTACKCEQTFNAVDIDDDDKKCVGATAAKTCINGLSDDTAGCDGTTQAKITEYIDSLELCSTGCRLGTSLSFLLLVVVYFFV